MVIETFALFDLLSIHQNPGKQLKALHKKIHQRVPGWIQS